VDVIERIASANLFFPASHKNNLVIEQHATITSWLKLTAIPRDIDNGIVENIGSTYGDSVRITPDKNSGFAVFHPVEVAYIAINSIVVPFDSTSILKEPIPTPFIEGRKIPPYNRIGDSSIKIKPSSIRTPGGCFIVMGIAILNYDTVAHIGPYSHRTVSFAGNIIPSVVHGFAVFKVPAGSHLHLDETVAAVIVRTMGEPCVRSCANPT
jgi:hypothetical protein